MGKQGSIGSILLGHHECTGSILVNQQVSIGSILVGQGSIGSIFVFSSGL